MMNILSIRNLIMEYSKKRFWTNAIFSNIKIFQAPLGNDSSTYNTLYADKQLSFSFPHSRHEAFTVISEIL